MGLIVSVYRDAEGSDCTLGGVSSLFTRLCLVNVPGPFNPRQDIPAAVLDVKHGVCRVYPCERAEPVAGGPANFDGWQRARGWYAMGGNYAATSDSRFFDAIEQMTGYRMYGAVPIHDRREH